MNTIIIKQANVVFHNKIEKLDILIEPPYIKFINEKINKDAETIIDASDLYVFPGIIDSHVHFREPGLTHKADIRSESLAAVSGGVTTVIDMPNTIPFADNIDTIRLKKQLAKNSYVNIGFFVGANIHNIETLTEFPKNEVAGIKVFLGSSTGDVMINDQNKLHYLFSKSYLPIAIHAENEEIIKKNLEYYRSIYSENIPFESHTEIRSREACFEASKMVIDIAKKYNTSIHLLHISTPEELNLIDIEKYPNITTEVCIPHLWFTKSDFSRLSGLLKCNPSVKTEEDKEHLRKLIKTEKVYTIGTDHAPHTYEEKQQSYLLCPSGTTSIQHSLLSMIELHKLGYFDLTTIAKKMSYNPAKKFKIKQRGEIKEGYFADLTIVNINSKTKVTRNTLLYKCKWSPFEGNTFNSSIEYTIVNGIIAYKKQNLIEQPFGKLLEYHH